MPWHLLHLESSIQTRIISHWLLHPYNCILESLWLSLIRDWNLILKSKECARMETAGNHLQVKERMDVPTSGKESLKGIRYWTDHVFQESPWLMFLTDVQMSASLLIASSPLLLEYSFEVEQDWLFHLNLLKNEGYFLLIVNSNRRTGVNGLYESLEEHRCKRYSLRCALPMSCVSEGWVTASLAMHRSYVQLGIFNFFLSLCRDLHKELFQTELLEHLWSEDHWRRSLEIESLQCSLE